MVSDCREDRDRGSGNRPEIGSEDRAGVGSGLLQVPVVDLDEEFKKLELRPLFWDTMHPSEKGNAVIAHLVASQITLLLNK